MQIETVKIAAPDVEGGHIVINKSDFDDKKMKLYAESKGRNSVHASDSLPSAEREVKLFFGVAALSH